MGCLGSLGAHPRGEGVSVAEAKKILTGPLGESCVHPSRLPGPCPGGDKSHIYLL